MTVEKIKKISESALANDAATLQRIPGMIEDAFTNRDISVASLFAYNLGRCKAEKEGKEYKSITEFKSDIMRCQTQPTRQEQETCGKALFGI